MTWVWHHSKSTSTARFVLLAIADCANDDGAEAYPSLAALTRKTKLSERTVQAALSKLAEIGELVIARNAGPRGCNKYRIVMRTPAESAPPQNPHPAESAPPPPQISHPTPADSASDPRKSRTRTVIEPSLQPSVEPSLPRKRGDGGTRIPEDFAATEEMIMWARENTPLVGGKETAAFVDYWRSQPGQRGRKVDWIATWRNWMRRAQSDAERGNGRASPRQSATNRAVNEALALAEQIGQQGIGS